ncbi:MAG: PEP-CTERM sorting domain-containing protein [Chitinophagaceae bacterium]|nr:PEP-CTERM sorting domain-containing protein [Rubrivivax sp.]
MNLKTAFTGLALVAGLAASQVNAQSLPIVDGFTSVKLTSAPTLTAAGLSVGVLGSALFSPGSDGLPLAYFPITGGLLNTGTFAGSIEHNGSGLRLSTASASVNLTDFVINTSALTLSGDVAFGGTSLADVPLFNLSASGDLSAPFTLTLTSTAAGALTTIFGLPNLTGLTVGVANTLPVTTVPEPATYLSLLGGLALIGGSLARRRAQAQAETSSV